MLLSPVAAFASDPAASNPIVLQDPSTRVVFYLESDRRHVAAISPEGKLLWCDEIIGPSRNGSDPYSISDIRFKNKDTLLYAGYAGAGVAGEIDKKTGKIRQYPSL
jgi:hypothetical protein